MAALRSAAGCIPLHWRLWLTHRRLVGNDLRDELSFAPFCSTKATISDDAVLQKTLHHVRKRALHKVPVTRKKTLGVERGAETVGRDKQKVTDSSLSSVRNNVAIPVGNLPIMLQDEFHFSIAYSAKLKGRNDIISIKEYLALKSPFTCWRVFFVSPLAQEHPLTLMNCTIPSGTEVLLSFCRYSMMSPVCKPTLTAAYRE